MRVVGGARLHLRERDGKAADKHFRGGPSYCTYIGGRRLGGDVKGLGNFGLMGENR